MAIKQLGKYDIIERLGRGGMAEVYKGYQASLDRHVAIKLLHPFLADDPEFKDRFEREARNVARLRHPNIVQVYDFEYDETRESYYMVMELIDGQTLKDHLTTVLKRGDQLSLEEIFRIIHGAGEALAYAHARGMIHRDVKPANLMLDSDNRIVLTDFGIAKIVTGVQFTASGGMVGTPAYMAPEQGLGEQGDERSDLYSLGVILFELVTGRLPYEGDTPLSVILKHLNEPIPSVLDFKPGVPEPLVAFIYKAMGKEPEERFQSADEMLRELNNVEGLIGLPSSAPRTAAKIETREMAAVPTITPPPPEPPPESSTPVTLPPLPASGRRGLGGIGAIIFIGAILMLGAFALGGGKLPLIGFVPSNTPTATVTASPTATVTPSNTVTPTPLPSATPTSSPTATFTPSATATHTFTPTFTASNTITPTVTASFTATPTATFTPTATASFTATPTATFTPTATSSFTATATFTYTPSFTPTWTASPTPTATYTPSQTPTPTVNITATLQAATLAAQNLTSTSVYATIDAIGRTQIAQKSPTPNYTATALRCKPQYFVVQGKAPERDPIRADTDFVRVITLRNTGDCDWLPGTYLQFSSGESFGASIKIIMESQEPVPPNSEAKFTFKGHTPRKGGLYTGNWEVRLYPDNKLLDPLLPITFFAYE